MSGAGDEVILQPGSGTGNSSMKPSGRHLTPAKAARDRPGWCGIWQMPDTSMTARPSPGAVEATHGERFATRAEMRQTVFEYIEVDYNRARRHSANGFISPEAFEPLKVA